MVRRECPLTLAIQRFEAHGCMDLELELEPAILGLLNGADVGDQQRLALLSELIHALHAQHGCLLAAMATAPARKDWARLNALRFVVHQGDAAEAAFLTAVQDQRLVVQLGNVVVAVPVRPVPARLPPGHVMVEMRNVPDDCARKGLAERVLLAAGYGPQQGVVVVHERLGMARGPVGTTLPFGRMDMVVAVVSAPPEDSALLQLPQEVWIEGQCMHIEVSSRLSPPAVRLTPQPTVPRAPAEPHAAVLARVGAVHGLTSQAMQAGPQPIADEVVHHARPPGNRQGLGFVRASSQPPPPAPPPPPPSRAAPPLPDVVVSDAPPPVQIPLDEPVFGAAVEYLQDEAPDLSLEEQQRSVLAVRDHSRRLYGDCVEASRVGDLPCAFRLALHHQARLLFGPRAGVPSVVAAAWDEGGEEASTGAEPGPGDPTGAAFMSDGEGAGTEDRGGAAFSGQAHMALRGRPGQRRPSRERAHSSPSQLPLRSSGRVPSAPRAWWKSPAVAPTTTTPLQAASARTGTAGAGGSCRRQ